ncbi:hypothetical protein L1887_25791 [Cichorium endivia]|nr:hypothetical protein L1887_25791 [Cichorium endivia]
MRSPDSNKVYPSLSSQQPGFRSQAAIVPIVSPKAKGRTQPSGGVSRGGGGLTPLALRSTKFCVITKREKRGLVLCGTTEMMMKKKEHHPNLIAFRNPLPLLH